MTPAGMNRPTFNNHGLSIRIASPHSAESVSQELVNVPCPHDESSNILPMIVTDNTRPIDKSEKKHRKRGVTERAAQNLATAHDSNTSGISATMTYWSTVWVTTRE